MPCFEDLKFFCFAGWVRHAALVNAVYPTEPGEEGPRQSQLARLLYYCETKSNKIHKVGNYLKRRYAWDAAKDKRAYHRVTLHIINQLLERSQHVSYFAKSVVWILNAMIEIGDPLLVAEITVTFMEFNKKYDACLDMDTEFLENYLVVMGRICAFALGETHQDRKELVLSGLEAVKSVVMSEFVFKSSKCDRYTLVLIPPILKNIRKGEKKEKTNVSLRRASIYEDVVNDDELCQIAIGCLQKLIETVSESQMKNLIKPIFLYFDEQTLWDDKNQPNLVFGAINQVASASVQMILLQELLQIEKIHVLPRIKFSTSCLAVMLSEIMETLMKIDNEQNVSKCLDWLTDVFYESPKDFLALLVSKSTKQKFIHSVLLFLTHKSEPFKHWTLDTFEPLFSLLQNHDLRSLVFNLLIQIPTDSSVGNLIGFLEEKDLELLIHHLSSPSTQIRHLKKLQHKPSLLHSFLLNLSKSIPDIEPLVESNNLDEVLIVIQKASGQLAPFTPMVSNEPAHSGIIFSTIDRHSVGVNDFKAILQGEKQPRPASEMDHFDVEKELEAI